MSSESEDSDFPKVRIKQEKLTPPRATEKDADEIINDIIPKLFSGSPTATSAENGDDEKKAIEPVKSSNEILAELFRVFNAAPPESLLNDEYLLDKKKKHSHKDKKHKKKSKKRSRGNSDQNDSGNDDKKPRKKSKKKKHKKSKKHDSNSVDEIKIKQEESIESNSKEKSNQLAAAALANTKGSDFSDFVISSEDEFGESKSRPDTVPIKQEKESSMPIPGKIVIKSLKNSAVFKEAEQRQEREQKNSSGHRDGSSELSLSDEETYLKEKQQRYTSRRDYREQKDRYRSRTDRDRYRNSSRDRFRRSWRDSRSHSRSRYRHRTRSRSRHPDDLVIDKKRLLEIARKNAISMFNNGSLPGTQAMTQEVKDKVLMKMRYGGKTVEELTEFCKKLSKGESLNDLSSLSSNDDSDHDKHGNERAFHHPFVLKDRGPIVMNIKNATPIPPKTAEQTKAILMQFPVSSGQQHRLNENEWIPVSATKAPRPEPPQPVPPPKPQSTKNVFAKPLPAESQQPAFVPNLPTEAIAPVVEKLINEEPATEAAKISPVPAAVIESVFPNADKVVDVTSIITKRLNAMRKLQDNPTDPEALKMMYNSQKDMSAWATSKFTPGQFTGSTGANILTARELTAGQQAWAKRDQLISTAPVSGGMGMHLLQKMGWRPGEGLGKGKNGSLQPLLLEVKLDKRGLVANEEDPNAVQIKNRRKKPAPTVSQAQQSIESKHPVSLLGELSAKRKWGAPFYELVDEIGPAHQKNFIYKVVLNGMMYQPAITCNTKKEAKALAAKYCLQQMGILPS